MKFNLLFKNSNYIPDTKLCYMHDTLKEDLGLDKVLSTMARDNKVIYTVSETMLFSNNHSLSDILYRQETLKDALPNASVVRKLFEISEEVFKKIDKIWDIRLHISSSSGTLYNAIRLLNMYVDSLMELRIEADKHLTEFTSKGFSEFLELIRDELTDEYFAEVHDYLNALKNNDGIYIGAKFGSSLQGVGYRLVRQEKGKRKRIFSRTLSYAPAGEDRVGLKELSRRYDYAINDVANALAQAAEHLDRFFVMLRNELAFFVGCLNLADTLKSIGIEYCIPEVLPSNSFSRRYEELYDVGLSIVKKAKVVGNTLATEKTNLYIITGVNQGGKTTFLRSLGQAQLMSQSGMIVGASFFSSSIANGVFSHFMKEEDREMKSGKLDEELLRMNEISKQLQSGSLMIFNESFATTNEREGSEIHYQIVKALIENEVEVFTVTHLTTFANMFREQQKVQYLRAKREDDDSRTFKLIPEEPQLSTFDVGLFNSVFGDYVKRLEDEKKSNSDEQ